eukprot:Hpha_TRINITY_DN23686_c0_g1::TRINITY_DN23686_c0_g1_i1::g.57536::m.57536
MQMQAPERREEGNEIGPQQPPGSRKAWASRLNGVRKALGGGVARLRGDRSTEGSPEGAWAPPLIYCDPNNDGRAAGLPPKCPAERARHAKEIANLMDGVRRQIAAERRKTIRDTEAIRRESREMEQTIAKWRELLPRLDKGRGGIPKSARELAKAEGVPSRMRPDVWERATGNSLCITPELYDICLRRGEGAGIELDLGRTFPCFQFFREGATRSALQGVLEAYAGFRPDVGYVQGMAYVAAVLLLFLEPVPAFSALANLIHSTHLLDFYRLSPRVAFHIAVFDLALCDTLPELHAHLEANGLQPRLYVLNWFMTMYARSLPLEVTCRIWDVFLLDDTWVYRAAVGILSYFQSELLQGGFEEGFALLSRLPEGITDEGAILKSILTVKLSGQRVETLRKRAELEDPARYLPPTPPTPQQV